MHNKPRPGDPGRGSNLPPVLSLEIGHVAENAKVALLIDVFGHATGDLQVKHSPYKLFALVDDFESAFGDVERMVRLGLFVPDCEMELGARLVDRDHSAPFRSAGRVEVGGLGFVIFIVVSFLFEGE